jgi:hypothetical protein
MTRYKRQMRRALEIVDPHMDCDCQVRSLQLPPVIACPGCGVVAGWLPKSFPTMTPVGEVLVLRVDCRCGHEYEVPALVVA